MSSGRRDLFFAVAVVGGTLARFANREIGVPRVRLETDATIFELVSRF